MATKTKSRPARWADAVGNARAALDRLDDARAAFLTELEALAEIKSEYEEWHANLPESLQGSALGEKLEEISNIDLEIEIDLEAASEALDNAESAELPLGFGRD